MMRMVPLVAPYPFLAPDPARPMTISSVVTIPEPYITGVELILFAAIVLLIVFALATTPSR